MDEFSSMLQKAGQPLHVYHGSIIITLVRTLIIC